MKILRMQAQFGCLDHAVLEPEPGLSVFVLPNESGKSTWSAFLLAMFYGIDTSRRSTKDHLAEKTRYMPWNGKPMSGILELEQDGRVIVLQRTSENGRPMGAFRAYDRQTGQDIPGLTGENCGLTLLGVERSVFERTAFLRGTELAVRQDEDLARRLGALAASGDREDSYPAAEEQLRQWQNRCRYHKTGRIPEIKEQLRQLEDQLEQINALRQQRLNTARQLEQVRARLAEIRTAQARSGREALEQAQADYAACEAKTAALPEEERLLAWQRQLDRQAPRDKQPEAPCPPALEGLEAGEIWPKVQKDLQHYEVLTAMTVRGNGLAYLIAGLLVLAALGLGLFRYWLSAALVLAFSGIFWAMALRTRRHNRQVDANLDEALALLESYGAGTRDQLLANAMARKEWLLLHETSRQQAWELELLLEEVQGFAPQVRTAEEARTAVEEALQLLTELDRAGDRLERAQYAQKTAQTGDRDLEHRKIALETEAKGLLRQEQSLGDWEQLLARQEDLQKTLYSLEQREQAIILARQALNLAQEHMTCAYAPKLTELASDYVNQLTGGRYDGLIFTKELSLSLRERESGLLRPLAYLSRGTQDQTWLALRLAMTELLLPSDTPIVLDDALLTFDEAREQQAKACLRQQRRQILLFSCR